MTKKPTPTKDEDTIARLEEERAAAQRALADIQKDIGALLGVINTLADALNAVDEWRGRGNRDTQRCLWCRAWKKSIPGHFPNCKRQLAIQALDDLKFYLNNRKEDR